MIWGRPAVKHSNRNGANRTRTGHKATIWLDGWTLAIPSVGLALVAALLAVPRATEPRWVPQPIVRPRVLNAEIDKLAGLAARARAQPLPFSVREVGEAYRRLGRAQFEATTPLDGAEIKAWRDLIGTVIKQVGNEPILVLRALQCELLVAAMRHWKSTGAVTDDLIELGGDLVSLGKANHWFKGPGLDLTQQERWALALRRWTSLSGLLHQPEFRPPRNLELPQLRFFYANPVRDDDSLEARQHILTRFSELDSTYPVYYAMGVLFAQTGQLDKAAMLFAKHLEMHPDGAFALRARNHLAFTSRLLHPPGDNDSP